MKNTEILQSEYLKKLLKEDLQHLHEFSQKRKTNILLDENVKILRAAFKDAGFKVTEPYPGMSDFDIKEQIAENTFIVTRNSKDFIEDAVKYDYDVIGIEGIKYTDTELTRKNITVQKIEKAIKESNIVNLVGNFFLEIKDDGSWKIRKIIRK